MNHKQRRKFVIAVIATLLSLTFITIGIGYKVYKQVTTVNFDTIADNTTIESTIEEPCSTIPVFEGNEIPNLIPTKEPEPVFEEYDIKLMAVGDNLFHMGVVNTGKQPDGTLDYTCLYEDLMPYLEKADIKIINQETILGGNELGFSGYPEFNSPTEVGDSLVKVGFNVVLHASNHSADKRVLGIDNCVNFWKKYPQTMMVGIHEPRDASQPFSKDEINIMTIGDYKFAILNYTYGPNYETVSKDIVSRMDILCNVSPNGGKMDFTTINPKVLEDIRTAKEIADVVIVCPHWGTEYQTKPSTYQETFAKQMTEAGADLIIGTHPHVVQPMEWITADNGNTSLCYYSLGNIVSTQKGGCSMLEALAWVNFHVTEDGISISKETSGILPLVCHYSFGPVRIKKIYPLRDYTEELAQSHGIIRYGEISFHLNDLLKWNEEIIGDAELKVEEIIQ